jgi:DnaJ-class molecular chaperone|tara:strand:- start:481 stop:681 length:201 start_codon:yes stop_codon:yes gene_type:complete
MAKLKANKVRRHICPTCKGNGFVKVIHEEDLESYVHQCWDCDSEGEFYVFEPEGIIGDNNSNHKLH